MLDQTTPGECSYRDYTAAFDRHTLNDLPWASEGNSLRTLVVTMPDAASNMRITRRTTDQGDMYSLTPVLPEMAQGVTYGAAQKVAGFLVTQRATKRVTHDTLRAHHVRKLLGSIFTLPENRDADRAHPPQVQNPPRERTPQEESYGFNTLEKLVKTNQPINPMLVRLPLGDTKLRLTREDDAIRLTFENAPEALEQKFTSLLAFNNWENPMQPAQLRAAVPAIGALCRRLARDSKPSTLNLPPARNYEIEPVRANVPEYTAAAAIETLREGNKLRWGNNPKYGSECIRITLPNRANDLLVARTHSVDGANHAIYAADPVAEGADPALVSAMRRWTQERTNSYSGVIDAEALRYLLEDALRLQSNQLATQSSGHAGGRAA